MFSPELNIFLPDISAYCRCLFPDDLKSGPRQIWKFEERAAAISIAYAPNSANSVLMVILRRNICAPLDATFDSRVCQDTLVRLPTHKLV